MTEMRFWFNYLIKRAGTIIITKLKKITYLLQISPGGSFIIHGTLASKRMSLGPTVK